MSNRRDNFSQRTKDDLALRASYLCSFCKCSTVGPSDERSNAVTMIGVAAHICAAASGPLARRYDPTMLPEQRSHIDNGIWLCATCGVLIDRDEVRFTPEALREIKLEHETSRRLGNPNDLNEDNIIAIGPEIILLGRVIRSSSDSTRIRLAHFVSGSMRDLWSMKRDFAEWPSERRYALLNELGYGALLAKPPLIELVDRSYEIELNLQNRAPCRDAREAAATMCRKTGGVINGLAAYIQDIECILGAAQGTIFSDLSSGSDISDLYWRYKGSPWFEALATMEMIRLSSIPRTGGKMSQPMPPFRIVKSVNRVEVTTYDLVEHHLQVNVEFNFQGSGIWNGLLSIFIATPDELISARQQAVSVNKQIRDIEAQFAKPGENPSFSLPRKDEAPIRTH